MDDNANWPGSACRVSTEGDAPGAFAHIPRAQRRELAHCAAAAVLSSVFFIAIGILSAPIKSRQLTAIHPLPPAAWSPTALRDASEPSTADAVPLPGNRPGITASTRPRLIARALPPFDAAAIGPDVRVRPLRARSAGRLSRMLLGDGRYRVQPFPTVRSSSQPE